jgi:hypothetical protein
MSLTGWHAIKQQRFELTLRNQKEASFFQSRLSQLQESQITALLDRVFAKYDNGIGIIQFERIHLNLGSIPRSQFEPEFIRRLEEELERYFSSQLRENGTFRNAKIIHEKDKKLDAFIHFLNRGSFSTHGKHDYKANALFKELISNDQKRLVAALKAHGKKPIVRKRLLLHFDEESLERMVLVVVPDGGSTIVYYKRKVLNTHREKPMVEASYHPFRQAVWEVILEYIIVEAHSYFNKKNFLYYLLQRVSKRYSIGYEDLLQYLFEVTKEKEKKSGSSEFERLLVDLHSDWKVSRKNRTELKSQSVNEWILEMDLFLNNGSFSADHSFATKEAFQHSFDTFLHAHHSLLQPHFKTWMEHTHVRHRLLTVLDDARVIQLLEVIGSSQIRIGLQFFASLNTISSDLGHQARKVLSLIQRKKGKMLLLSWSKHQTEKATIWKSLLATLQLEIAEFKSLFPEIGDALKKVLSPDELNILDHAIPEAVDSPAPSLSMDQMARLGLSYFTAHPKAQWKRWLDEHFSRIAREFTEFRQALNRLEVPKEIALFVSDEWDKRSGNGIAKSDPNPLFKKLLDEVQKLETSELLLFEIQFRKSILVKSYAERYGLDEKELLERLKQWNVEILSHADLFKNEASSDYFEFVIREHKLPWWHPSYTWEAFNREFAFFWTDPDKKCMLLEAIKTSKDNSIVKLLTGSNTQIYLEVIKEQTSSWQATVLHALNQLVSSQFFPLKLITNQEYSDFRIQIVELLPSRQGKYDSVAWERLIKRWTVSLINLTRSEVHGLLLPMLEEFKSIFPQELNALIEQVKQEMPSASEHTQKETQEVSDPLSPTPSPSKELAFVLTHFHQLERNKLISYFKVYPSLFKKAIEQKDLFTTIVKDWSEAQKNKLVINQLGTNQSVFFNEAVSILKRSSYSLSNKAFKLLEYRFYFLVLYKLRGTGFTGWTVHDWSDFMLRLFESNRLSPTNKSVIGGFLNQETTTPILQENEQSGILKNMIDKNIAMSESLEETPEEKPYRKLGEEEPLDFSDGIYCKNAGIILLAPFLGTLFERAGLVENKQFKDERSQHKGVQLLDFAAKGSQGSEEHELVIQKVLCGINVQDPIDLFIELTDSEKELVEGLLKAVIQQWHVLNNTSIEGLQTSFLQRNGLLKKDENGFQLHVESLSYDMLLDSIPWNISILKLSWMEHILNVSWR